MFSQSRRFTVSGATLLACALPFAFGCGTQSSKKEVSVKDATPVTAPAPSVDTPVSTASDEPVIPVNVSFKEAHAAYTNGDYANAVLLFKGYTNSHTENAWGYYMLGLSAWKSGDLAGAELAFNTALTLEPAHERSLFNSSRVLIEDGKASEALPRVEEILSQNPGSGEGYRLLGRTQYALGKVDEAIDAYHQALAIDVNDVWAMNNLGLILIQQGRFEEAVPALARAVELQGTSAVIQNNLGVALERTGRFTAATAAYEAALAADSGYTKASVARTRVTGRTDVEGVGSDLASLSVGFQDLEQGWKNGPTDSVSTVATQNSDTMAGETEASKQ